VLWIVLSLYFVLVLVVMSVLGIVFLVFFLSDFGFWCFSVEFLFIFSCCQAVFDVAEGDFGSKNK
jgi:hypothetical protein